jgi:hypothetical protein
VEEDKFEFETTASPRHSWPGAKQGSCGVAQGSLPPQGQLTSDERWRAGRLQGSSTRPAPGG